MIKASEISDAELNSLALFFATNGAEGECPSWYKLFVLAMKVNAPVWEVEEILGGNEINVICGYDVIGRKTCQVWYTYTM